MTPSTSRATSLLARLFGISLFAFPLVAASIACSSDKDSSGADSGDAGPQCGSYETFIECDICCEMPNFYQLLNKVADDCVCDDACKNECASACAATNPTAPSEECSACRESDRTAATCSPKVQAECDKDPECAKAQACSRAAQCIDKPDDVDGG